MRCRKLPLLRTIHLILELASGSRLSSQNSACLKLFPNLNHCPSSRSSLTEARQKVPWTLFEHLLEKALFQGPKWKGLRVLALDGSKFWLPKSNSVLKQFKMRKTGEFYPGAQLVCAYDVMTSQPVSADLDSVFASEHNQAQRLTKKFKQGDLLLLDRGFQSKKLWISLLGAKLHFICRVRSNTTQWMGKSKDRVIEIDGHLIRYVREGNVIVATSLLRAKIFPRHDVIDLYKKRWTAETGFRRLKQTLNLQSFHSRTENGIRQELFASLLLLALLAGIGYCAQPRTGHQVNFDLTAFAFFGEMPSILFSRRPVARNCLRKLLQTIVQFTQPPRTGRSFPRFSKQPANRWISARRTNNHVQSGHWKCSNPYR